jgi:hypothetical protein
MKTSLSLGASAFSAKGSRDRASDRGNSRATTAPLTRPRNALKDSRFRSRPPVRATYEPTWARATKGPRLWQRRISPFGVRKNCRLGDKDEHPRRLGVVPLELVSQVPEPRSPACAIPDREPQPHTILVAGGRADVTDDAGRDTAAYLDRCLELPLLAGREGL